MSKCKDPEHGKLLHAYEMNTLSEADSERFEIHLISCEHCFSEVNDFEETASLLRSDEDVKTLTREMAREAAPKPATWGEKLRRYLWPEAPLAFKPALAYLVAIALFIPAYNGLRETEQVAQGIRPVQTINCIPVRGSTGQVFQRSTGEAGIVNFVFVDAVPGETYQVIIRAEDGSVAFEDENFNRFESGYGSLLLPLSEMKPGRYQLTITDQHQASPMVQEYSFVIEE